MAGGSIGLYELHSTLPYPSPAHPRWNIRLAQRYCNYRSLSMFRILGVGA